MTGFEHKHPAGWRKLTLRVQFFLRLLIWFSLRHLRRHRWRAVAVLLGIALGAAVFTSVRIAINASLDSFSRSMDMVAGKADWVIVRPGGRVPHELVAGLPCGIKPPSGPVAPRRFSYALLHDPAVGLAGRTAIAY